MPLATGGWLEEKFPLFYRAVTNVQLWGHRGRCSCPNKSRHKNGDANPSLLVMLGESGSLIFDCRSGCGKLEVLAACGFSGVRAWQAVCHDRLNKSGSHRPQGHDMRQLVATYEYIDFEGVKTLEVLRFHPKEFMPRRRLPACEGGWVYNLTGGPVSPVVTSQRHNHPYAKAWISSKLTNDPQRVVEVPPWEPHPYNAHLLSGTADSKKLVFWVEGEGKADLLCGLGFVAVSTQGGSHGRHWDRSWNKYFADRVVLFLADNDRPGREYASHYAGRCLSAGVKAVGFLELPELPLGGDVRDWKLALDRSVGDAGLGTRTAAKLLREMAADARVHRKTTLSELFPSGKSASGAAKNGHPVAS